MLFSVIGLEVMIVSKYRSLTDSTKDGSTIRTHSTKLKVINAVQGDSSIFFIYFYLQANLYNRAANKFSYRQLFHLFSIILEHSFHKVQPYKVVVVILGLKYYFPICFTVNVFVVESWFCNCIV